MNFKMRTVFLASLLVLSFSGNLKAEVLKGNFVLSKSKINYLVTYLIKKVDGESLSSQGKGECKSTGCDFLVAAPIKSFISKDANRDLNMLTVVKSDKFPLVIAKIKTPTQIENGKLTADLEIEFVGVKFLYKNVIFNASFVGGLLHVEGSFNLDLDFHKLEKPSLLGVDINKITPLTIVADWKNN